MAAPNWSNQTIWTADNLDIMRGMNSESVDLIYLDPPFNSKVNYAAPIGSKAAGAAFKDTWGLDDVNLAWHGEIKHEYPGMYSLLTATREIHGDSMMSYLIYMAVRIMEMRRLLKSTGAIYLHCDPTARAFSDHSGSYPELAKKLAHSVGVKSSMISAMASHRSSTVRAAAFLSRALSLAKACSMGLKSGE